MLAGYDHLLRAASRLAWDDAAIDLRADAAAWPRLAGEQRATIRRLLAGFVVAESAVAEQLAPFEAAASDPQLRACFAAQAEDERRHARFFTRAAAEIAGIDSAWGARTLAGADVCALFERELADAALELATGIGDLSAAVSLYHLVLEGVAFHAGQQALLDVITQTGGALPGLQAGVTHVQADERWHVGLGVYCLQTAGAPTADLTASARRAAACWGVEVDVEAVLAVHRRRVALLGARAIL